MLIIKVNRGDTETIHEAHCLRVQYTGENPRHIYVLDFETDSGPVNELANKQQAAHVYVRHSDGLDVANYTLPCIDEIGTSAQNTHS